MCGGGDVVIIVGISEKSRKLKPSSRRVLSVHIGGVSCDRIDRVGIVVPQ